MTGYEEGNCEEDSQLQQAKREAPTDVGAALNINTLNDSGAPDHPPKTGQSDYA